jgi:hypothetical protein
MMVEQIKQRLSNGFQPFTLHLSNGKRLPVPHRDFIAFSTRIVVVIDEHEVSHVVNPVHIVTIEDGVRS